LLAVAYYNRKVRVWDTDGTNLATWDADALALDFTPDGEHVAGLQSDRTLKSWRLDGSSGVALPGATGVEALAFSPDGRWLATASAYQTLRLWDMARAADAPTWEAKQPNVRRLHFSSDSQTLCVGTEQGLVAAYDAADGRQRWAHTQGGGLILALAQQPDDKWLAADWTYIKQYGDDGPPTPVLQWSRPRVLGLAFDAPRQRILIGQSYEKGPQVWSNEGQLQLDAVQHEHPFVTAAVSPDGSRVVSVGWDQRARLWNASSGAVEHVLAEHRGATGQQSAAFGPDGQSVAIGSQQRMLNVWNIDGTLRWSMPALADAVWSVAYSPDGRRVLAGLGDRDKSILVFDADSGRQETVLRGHEAAVRDLAFSLDGRLASCGSDRTIRLWNSEGKADVVLRGHTNTIHSLAWHPDGQSLASASSDGTCRVWRADGTALVTLKGHLSDVYHVSFSADGSQILAATDDGVVRTWDASNGQPRDALLLLANKQAAAFDASGRLLANTAAATRELLYLLERPDGGLDMLDFDQFRQRSGL
jgi:WD40 repeat protein